LAAAYLVSASDRYTRSRAGQRCRSFCNHPKVMESPHVLVVNFERLFRPSIGPSQVSRHEPGYHDQRLTIQLQHHFRSISTEYYNNAGASVIDVGSILPRHSDLCQNISRFLYHNSQESQKTEARKYRSKFTHFLLATVAERPRLLL